MAFKIREGKPSDMSSVLGLIKELAVFEKEPDAVKITIEDLLEFGFNENPSFFIYVAEDHDKILGAAIFYKRFSTWVGPSLHLEDLIVSEKFRGQGVGKALYDQVLNYALETKVQRVEWVVLDWNQPAIDFYKNSGAIMYDDWNICQMSAQSIANYLSRK